MKKFAPEVRERGIQVDFNHGRNHPSRWGGGVFSAEKIRLRAASTTARITGVPTSPQGLLRCSKRNSASRPLARPPYAWTQGLDCAAARPPVGADDLISGDAVLWGLSNTHSHGFEDYASKSYPNA